MQKALVSRCTRQAGVTESNNDPRIGMRFPTISPDGCWLAYESDQKGRREVYVTPFPGPGPRMQVSVNGGYGQVWAPDGRTLYFRGESVTDGQTPMMAVAVATEPSFSVSPANVLFSGNFFMGSPLRNHDISPDGSRFLMCRRLDGSIEPVTQFHLTLNRFTELERLVPTD